MFQAFTFTRRICVAGSLLLLLIALAGCARMLVADHLAHFSGAVIEKPAAVPILNNARSNLVTILALDEQQKPVEFGSGFYIRSNQVVTCLHVIEAAHSLRIELPDGTQHDVAGIYGTDSLVDTAVLWTTNPPPTTNHLPLRDAPVEQAESVYVLGAVKRLPISAARGEVIKVLELGTEHVTSAFELSAPVLPGFSGGPILDTDGNVIGITTAMTLAPGERVSIGLPVQEIVGRDVATPVSLSDWRQLNPLPDKQALLALARGDALMFRNEQEALKEYDRALTLSTNLPRAWLRRGLCLMRLERSAEALRAFQTLLQMEPGVIMPRVCYALCLAQEKRFAEAKQEVQTILMHRPNSSSAFFTLAAVCLEEKDLPAALTATQSGAKLSQYPAQAQRALGEVWSMAGVPSEAEKCFRRVLELEPQQSAIWLRLGAVQMEQGHDVEAVVSLNEVLRGNQYEFKSAARYRIYSIAVRNNEMKAAKREFGNFLTEETIIQRYAKVPAPISKQIAGLKNRDWNSAPAQGLLAEVFVKTKRPFEGFVAFETQTSLAPDDAKAWLNLADVYNARWRFDKAREVALKALSLHADPVKGYQSLGKALCALGELDEARMAFNKALAVDQRSATTLLGLACIEARVGNIEKSKQLLAEAKSWDNSFPVQFEAAPETILPDAKAIRLLVAQ